MSRASAAAGRPLRVLLVEDDPGDVVIAREALQAARVHTDLHVVPDGTEAMAFLHRQGAHADAERPDLILLDLNLPGMSGHEVLAAVKGDETLRRIPVVVLSTSSSAADVTRSYDLHANVHVAKPVDFNAFAQVVQKIEEFFGGVAELPE